MLTPQEVAEHSFAKASFNGYNMAQVDDFLDEVTRDYETLYNDNALLKQKLAVLSGKIKEYQSTEEAMRKTLLTAQTMADEMVKEAEAKRAALLREGEAEVRIRISTLEAEEKAQRERLNVAATATELFVSKTRGIIDQQVQLLDSLSQITPPPRPEPQSDKLDEISQEVAQALEQEAAAQETEEETAVFTIVDEVEEELPSAQDRESRRASLFADLGNNFGKEAELK